MTIRVRLCAAVCLGLLAAGPSPAAAPAAALPTETAQPDPTDDLATLRAHVTARRFDEARALAARLLEAPATDPVREARLLDMELDRQYGSGDLAALAAVEARARAAAANPEIPAATRISLLHSLMTVYTRVPRLDDALAVIDQQLALLGDTPSQALLDALRAKGGVHAMRGQFPQGIEALLRADNVVQALGLPPDAGIMRNLAGIFLTLGEFDRAVEYAERAERVQREAATPPRPAQRKGVLSMLATAHIGAGHFEQGERWSREAIAYGREHGLSVDAETSNYATLLRDAGRHTEALALYRELAAGIAPNSPTETRGVVEKNIGETLVALGRRSEAATHLQRAREIYETADIRPKRLELYPVLIENLEALGRTAEALAAMHEFKALSDETINAESRTRIGELESTIDLARKSQALADAETANELQRASNEALLAQQERARAINLALAACLVALVAVLALLWRTHRIRNRSHRQLSERNAEIEEQRNVLQQLNATIHQQSLEDALTGLGNRRQLLEAMSGADAAGSLLVMADLDHFKRINDEHGHDTGDRALRLVADALRAAARSGDLAVRWGGEEFVWVCRGAGAAQAPALCERLLRQLRARPLDVGGRAVPITASLGFAPLPVWPDVGPDWDSALRIADYGVYCTKAAGRDGWTGFIGQGSGHGEVGSPPAALEERGRLRRIGPGDAIAADLPDEVLAPA